MNKKEIQLNVNENIFLRQVRFSDALAIFNAIDSQREYFKEWLPFVDNTQTIADTENYIKAVAEVLEQADNYVFVVLYKNQFAGLIGLKDTDYNNKRTEIGYWLCKQFQKKGIITQSLSCLMDFIFNQMNLHRIQIRCGAGNFPSKNIPKRLGFTLEGIERDGELLSNGNYIDLEVYSKLSSDK